jgi:hypothetical protein
MAPAGQPSFCVRAAAHAIKPTRSISMKRGAGSLDKTAAEDLAGHYSLRPKKNVKIGRS